MPLYLTGMTRLLDPELDAQHRLSRWDRGGGLVAFFLPAAVVFYGITFGLGFSSPGPDPREPIGRWLGRRGVLSLPLDFLVVLGVLGLAWLIGVPTWRRSIWRYLGGIGFLGLLAIHCAMQGDVDHSVPFLALAAVGLIVSAILYDRP